MQKSHLKNGKLQLNKCLLLGLILLKGLVPLSDIAITNLPMTKMAKLLYGAEI